VSNAPPFRAQAGGSTGGDTPWPKGVRCDTMGCQTRAPPTPGLALRLTQTTSMGESIFQDSPVQPPPGPHGGRPPLAPACAHGESSWHSQSLAALALLKEKKKGESSWHSEFVALSESRRGTVTVSPLRHLIYNPQQERDVYWYVGNDIHKGGVLGVARREHLCDTRGTDAPKQKLLFAATGRGGAPIQPSLSPPPSFPSSSSLSLLLPPSLL